MVGCEVAALCSGPIKLELNTCLKSVKWKKKLLDSVLNVSAACDGHRALYKQLKNTCIFRRLQKLSSSWLFPL